MKQLIKTMYLSLSLLLLSCDFVPCEKVTDKDILGYYVTCYPENRSKQYIKILENHTFTMAYCSGDSIVIEQGTWKRYNSCKVELDGIRWLWIPEDSGGISRSRASFTWVRGMLSFGDCTSSFQKTWRKPKLACEK